MSAIVRPRRSALHMPGSNARALEKAKRLAADTLIHPSQLAPFNQIFSPIEDEVETAGRIIAAFEQAPIERAAVVTVDGKMIESLHVEDAPRTVAMASAIAAINQPTQ